MSIIVKSEKTKNVVQWIGNRIESPEQRLLLGATALATQPFIDLNNENVDENTRLISVARTLAKIIAGTVTGVLIRKGFIELARKYGKYSLIKGANGVIEGFKPKTSKDIFCPVIKKLKKSVVNEREFQNMYRKYTSAFGTLIATGVMVFTNFIIDAPLTRYFTGIFHKYITKEKLENKKEANK